MPNDTLYYLGSARVDLGYWMKTAPDIPPSIKGCLKNAEKHLKLAIEAVNAAAMIETGGLPVPEEYRDVA